MRPFALPTAVLVAAALLVGGASGDCTGSDGPRNNLLQKMNNTQGQPSAGAPTAPAAAAAAATAAAAAAAAAVAATLLALARSHTQRMATASRRRQPHHAQPYATCISSTLTHKHGRSVMSH